MPETRGYDSKKVTVVVDGVTIRGLAEGTFVECSKNEDFFESEVGGHGEVSVSETNDPRGTVSITLKQTSPDVPFLDSLANSKKVVPVWVYSSNDPKEKSGGSEARCKRPASKGYNRTAQNREFEFEVFDYQAG